MTQYLFSRRRLLCGLLSGLIAWLCPRPSRAVASPRSQPNLVDYCTVNVYDAENNFIDTYSYACESPTVPTSSSPYSYSYDVNTEKAGKERKGGQREGRKGDIVD